MRMTSILALLALLAACGESATAPARPRSIAPTSSPNGSADVFRAREEQTYSDTMTTCEGDLAAVEASFARREQLVFLPDGTVRITTRWTVRMHGTVLSTGAQYIGEMSLTDIHAPGSPGSGVIATEVRTIRLHGVTQGPTDNLFETLTFQTIYDGNGGDTVVIRGKSACTG